MLLTSIIIFIIAAAVSVLAAIRLATYADIISRETKAGGLVVGTVLLAVATSLPELTATISAAVIDNADIAVGNGLGSITFNIFALFLFDIYFRKKRLFLKVSNNHFYTGLLGLTLCTIIILSLYFNLNQEFIRIGLPSIAIAVVYLGGLWLISLKHQQEIHEEETAPRETEKTAVSVKKAIVRFILFSFIIFASGSSLSVSGDFIAQSSGISASAIGSILIAATTSLPDAVSVLVALRAANVNLAIGTILGGNIFNVFVIPIADIFYRSGSIWADASKQQISTAAVGFMLTLIVISILKRDNTRNTMTYISPSLIVVGGYLIFSAFYILG
ncbi:sodium:calcium antiporter [Virgibacillus litoralis]|uniref:Cation:H+ antiporter n=1 Tax=Virgibacillus litoralis TaxID=578221 RepID=A0ABS4HH06_9BACI|nr:sodium:calcium antiporter [Virgibacillus litoralis]MBP1950210.1 cation:H+ antiporter [Virgibacillus litoralis]